MTVVGHIVGFVVFVFLGGVAFQAADDARSAHRDLGGGRYALGAICAYGAGLCLTALGFLILVNG